MEKDDTYPLHELDHYRSGSLSDNESENDTNAKHKEKNKEHAKQTRIRRTERVKYLRSAMASLCSEANQDHQRMSEYVDKIVSKVPFTSIHFL